MGHGLFLRGCCFGGAVRAATAAVLLGACGADDPDAVVVDIVARFASPVGAEAELRLDCLDDDEYLFRGQTLWRAPLGKSRTFESLRVRPDGEPRPLRFVARLTVAGAERFAGAARADGPGAHVTIDLGTAPLDDADIDGVPDDVDDCPSLWDPSGACLSAPPRGVRRSPPSAEEVEESRKAPAPR